MSNDNDTTIPRAATTATYIYKGVEDVPRNIKHVLIHSSVIEIERYAFKGCSNLQSVMIESKKVIGIGRSAFGHCTALTSIDIPEGVKWIGENAFRDCTSLSFVRIPSTVTSIGIAAFRCCKSLKVVDLPSSIQRICFAAFYHCDSLISISMPSAMSSKVPESSSLATSTDAAGSITSSLRISPAAFRGCRNLINIALPQNITFIQQSGGFDSKRYPYFSQCDTLERVLSVQNKDHKNNGTSTKISAISSAVTTTNTGSDTSTSTGNGTIAKEESEVIEIHTWLQRRFNDLLLHQECYKQNVTLQNIQEIIQKNPMKDTVQAKDELGVTALHILACNRHSSTDMMKYILDLYPSLSSIETANGLTPLQLFLKCNDIKFPSCDNHKNYYNIKEKGLVCDHQCRLCLGDALKQGLHWNLIDRILTLDPKALLELHKVDCDTGFVPFVQAAILPQCNVDVVYSLTRQSVGIMLSIVNLIQ